MGTDEDHKFILACLEGGSGPNWSAGHAQNLLTFASRADWTAAQNAMAEARVQAQNLQRSKEITAADWAMADQDAVDLLRQFQKTSSSLEALLGVAAVRNYNAEAILSALFYSNRVTTAKNYGRKLSVAI